MAVASDTLPALHIIKCIININMLFCFGPLISKNSVAQ